MALHRKVHLFDIDIPGKITFRVRRLHHGCRLFHRLILPRPIPRRVRH